MATPIGVNAQDATATATKPPDRTSWASQPKYKPDELLVRFRPGTTPEKRSIAHSAVKAEQVKSWPSVDGLQLVRVSAGVSIQDAIKLYRQRAEVLYAEPNYYLHAFTTPNDAKFPQLWGLQNTGQLTGTAGADIHAAQAWSITTGSSNVVVAVIDTGMDYTHQDLAANAWSSTAPYSVTVNGTTINCPVGSHGFNAVSNSCDPMDDNGHGTHVSGTIGAAGNNGVGVAGVNWSVRIMPCKFLDSSGGGTTDAAVTCLDFVKSMKDAGEKIVATNNSWGGGGFSQALFDTIQAQQQDGVLFIAAAGNDSSNTDLGGFYPGGYFLPNIVSVAATTRFDLLANFSNIGSHSVTLGAPGQEILSTFPNNSYAWLNGTSMATPHVTGVAALLAAQDPSRDWRAIKNLLIAGGDTIPALSETISGKRLNAYGSMTCSNSTVARRLQPTLDTIVGSVGTPILLSALNINCAQPVGPVTVNVVPGNQTINLADNGTNPDQAAQDGIYTGQWTPPGIGNYKLTFSTGESMQVTVLNNYVGG
ncbi:MAG TPA: S8 family peptidase, partial [Candidatus Acidoferrum sp.]|nr:S8 family peptidase [Candidatus Acidoferrum sp.]